MGGRPPFAQHAIAHRVWILVADGDSDERILETAVRLGATEL